MPSALAHGLRVAAQIVTQQVPHYHPYKRSQVPRRLQGVSALPDWREGRLASRSSTLPSRLHTQRDKRHVWPVQKTVYTIHILAVLYVSIHIAGPHRCLQCTGSRAVLWTEELHATPQQQRAVLSPVLAC